MNTVSKQLLQSSKELAKSSSEVNSLNQKLSISSSEFSSSIHTTINNLKQNNTLVVKTCNNIESGLLKTKKSQDEATEGLAVVQQFEQAMNEVANSSKKMEVIRDIVQKIELKTKVIDDIVFQTKLLSFNASIEAERAGQHGNCFAVVAIQVGKMAVASGAAAEEISLFIQESSSLAMVTLDETSFKADYGQRISVICREVFEQIIINIVEMMEKISNISNATQEQKIGLTKISLAIDSLSQISAQNVHLASQAQEVAGKIQSLADSLQTNTSSLEKILMDDKKSIDSSSVEKLKLVS